MKTTDQRLKELVDAAEEARKTLRELHEARAILLDIDRKMRDRITKAIQEEIDKQINEIANEAREQMVAAFDRVASDASLAIKEKLGI